jgi:large subunit ribosomal protein L4e
MKVDIHTITGGRKTKIDLPSQFNEELRPDLIKDAVLAIQSNSRQPYGADPLAGTRQGEATPKRRRKYRTTYGHGVSRIKRKIMSRNGLRFGWVGAFVASAVGGRRAFPPSAQKINIKKLNKKQRRFAIRSAISATCSKELVLSRGHRADKLVEFPLILEDKVEKMSKTKDVISLLNKLNLKEELSRISARKVRPGISKMRGRKYKIRKGPLFVVSDACPLEKAAKNIPGIDIVRVKNLNAENLAPGTQPGRLVLWSEDAVKQIEKERLFL